MFFFVVDRNPNEIVKFMNNYQIKSLSNVYIEVQQAIKGTNFLMWDILMFMPEDYLDLVKMISKTNIVYLALAMKATFRPYYWSLRSLDFQ